MLEDLLWFLLPDIYADVRVQQKPGVHSQPLPFLRAILIPVAAGNFKIFRHGCEKFERSDHVAFFLSQDDFVAATKYFNLLAFKAKLLRQANRLAVP
jgi:hypothetical protein